VTAAARRRLERFTWPGNVRQLENEVRRALILAEDVIDVDDLTIPEAAAAAPADLGLDLRARIDRLEVELVGEALERTRGNQTRAAELLGVSRFGLHKMMKRLGMK
jgi:DNA-binding NtrC family response regulator